MATRFEWDERKAEANWKKHKVRFQAARVVWQDRMAIDEPDETEHYGEDRFNRIGMADDRLLRVTYTEHIDEESRDEIIRIISARKATRREAREYHEA